MIRVAAGLLAGFFLMQPAFAQTKINGVYQFREAAVILAGIHFARGEAVQIEIKEDQAEIHFQLHTEEEGEQTFTTLSKEELAQLPLELSAVGGMSEFGKPQSWRPDRLKYKGASGCVAYVMRAIGWRGGRTGNGWEVTRTLRRFGWHTVSCRNPSYGTVASWYGGHSGAGHTAIWQGCWAYDLGCGDPGAGYRLIDCVAR